jgi:hypothetical protein
MLICDLRYRQAVSEPLPEDAARAFVFINSYSGLKGKHLIQETGFGHDRTIDAVKVLVLRNLVHVDVVDYPVFAECRIHSKV